MYSQLLRRKFKNKDQVKAKVIETKRRKFFEIKVILNSRFFDVKSFKTLEYKLFEFETFPDQDTIHSIFYDNNLVFLCLGLISFGYKAIFISISSGAAFFVWFHQQFLVHDHLNYSRYSFSKIFI